MTEIVKKHTEFVVSLYVLTPDATRTTVARAIGMVWASIACLDAPDDVSGYWPLVQYYHAGLTLRCDITFRFNRDVSKTEANAAEASAHFIMREYFERLSGGDDFESDFRDG